ncbi:unnamed protein product [Gongylonema pulchrum]|uniref:Mitochondrial pyruvate carrier n=1 Tax=Gongylonema pulchrum TaxID=637853 RepID=A0A183CZA5_9BILA|nr:unnamed protein product [Gongylonema pulchrum]
MNTIWEYAVGGYLPLWQKVAETAFFVPLGIYGIYASSKSLEVPSFVPKLRKCERSSGDTFVPSNAATPSEPSACEVSAPVGEDVVILSAEENSTRYSIIAFYSLIFGAELTYKLITRYVKPNIVLQVQKNSYHCIRWITAQKLKNTGELDFSP